jgi:hypothetical protein
MRRAACLVLAAMAILAMTGCRIPAPSLPHDPVPAAVTDDQLVGVWSNPDGGVIEFTSTGYVYLDGTPDLLTDFVPPVTDSGDGHEVTLGDGGSGLFVIGPSPFDSAGNEVALLLDAAGGKRAFIGPTLDAFLVGSELHLTSPRTVDAIDDFIRCASCRHIAPALPDMGAPVDISSHDLIGTWTDPEIPTRITLRSDGSVIVEAAGGLLDCCEDGRESDVAIDRSARIASGRWTREPGAALPRFVHLYLSAIDGRSSATLITFVVRDNGSGPALVNRPSDPSVIPIRAFAKVAG